VEAGKRSRPCSSKKRRPLLVEGGVIAVDIAQVTGGADDVFPGGALTGEQPGDVLISPALLEPEVADMDRAALIVDAGGAGNEQHDDIAEFELQARGKTNSAWRTRRPRSALQGS